MSATPRTKLLSWVVLLSMPFGITRSEEPPRLLMFGNESPRGMWRMEILESSDPASLKASKEMGSVSVCMDAAVQMGKQVATDLGSRCTTRTLSNTRASAVLETTCAGGRVTRVTMTRESAKALLVAVVESGGTIPASSMKSRYHLEGSCPDGANSNVLKADKDSPECAEMRAEAAAMTPEAVCGSVPEEQKAACLKQLEATLASSMKMCQ